MNIMRRIEKIETAIDARNKKAAPELVAMTSADYAAITSPAISAESQAELLARYQLPQWPPTGPCKIYLDVDLDRVAGRKQERV